MKKIVLLAGAFGVVGVAAGLLVGMFVFRPASLPTPGGLATADVSYERALIVPNTNAPGMIGPRTAARGQSASASPTGERSLTQALEEAGELPPLSPRTADIQRTETLIAAWDETEDRALRTAIIDELRIRQVPRALEFAEEMLRSPEAPDRFISALQLRTMGDPAAVEALAATLAQETDPRAELMEAYALSRIQGPDLDPATRAHIEKVVPQQWRDQDAVERGGLFDLAVLDGTALEELKPELAWWTGQVAQAAMVEREAEVAAQASEEARP